ncbi:MAG: hypothetical protein M1831_005149 [Alyxoria varia]|nr:MAG: hypothetical protein M1831_005149 [Alyxoria varia]
MSSETLPLHPKYKETLYEFDRLYQRFGTTGRHIYWCPIDEGEEERLFIQDEIVQLAFGANLFFRCNTYPQKILDCGLLRGGGTIQMMEYNMSVQSDNGTLTEKHAIYQWGAKYRAAMQLDRNPRIGATLSRLLRDAGLKDLEERYIQLPIGSWPENARQRAIGQKNLDNIDRLLDNFGLMPLIKRGGMSKDSFLELTEQARREARDPRLKLYIPL